jgi:hypothetical protein
VLAAAVAAIVLFLMIELGGVVLLATFIGSAATVISVPVLWLIGKRRNAGRLLGIWAGYLAFYVVVSTGIALFFSLMPDRPLPVGQETCADSGCFAVDKVDRTPTGSETVYTLFWHLASNDAQMTKRFPGRGLELYMFDERGRTFKLPDNSNLNPLDVMLPAGETVRESMRFSVPADARELFLTAKYRPFTFQSLLPGELSLVPHRHAAMIRIQ